MGQEIRIDELAQRAGTKSTTVRLYQARGLLPAPRREGREGYYGDAHLARLQLILDLQERGFSLRGIKELIDAWSDGRDLDELLGLQRRTLQHWSDQQPLTLSLADLAASFQGQPISPELIQRVVTLGLVQIDGDTVTVPIPAFHEAGARLAGLGIPPAEVVDEYEAAQVHLAELAQRFVGLFERRFLASFIDDGATSEQMASLTVVLDELTNTARATLIGVFSEELRKAAEEMLSRYAVAPPAGAPRE